MQNALTCGYVAPYDGLVSKTCEACGVPIAHPRRRWCPDHGEQRGGVPRDYSYKRTDVDCVGGCGQKMWQCGKAPPVAGEAKCRPCRRAALPQPQPPTLRVVTCRCGVTFETMHVFKIWCTVGCRIRLSPGWSAPKTNAQRHGRSGRPWLRVRQVVIAEESFCWLCGIPVDKSRRFPDPWSATVDHVIPAARGGTNERQNLRLAHYRCNNRRGQQT